MRGWELSTSSPWVCWASTCFFHEIVCREAHSDLKWCLPALWFFCSGCTFCAFMSLTPEAENIELDLRWTEWWRYWPQRNAASVVITGWDFFHNSGYSCDSVFSSFVTYNIKPVFHFHIGQSKICKVEKKKLHPLLTSPLENHCFPCVAYVSPWTCPCLPQETFSVPIRSVYLCPPRTWTRTLTPLELITTAYLEHLRIHTHTCTCMYLN